MKFKKKVVESAVVGAFTLAMVVTVGSSNQFSNRSNQTQEKVFAEAEYAMTNIVNEKINLVAASNPLKHSWTAGVVSVVKKEVPQASVEANTTTPTKTTEQLKTVSMPVEKTTDKESKEPNQTSKTEVSAKKESDQTSKTEVSAKKESDQTSKTEAAAKKELSQISNTEAATKKEPAKQITSAKESKSEKSIKAKKTTKQKKSVEKKNKASKWDNRIMPKVEEYLNIRSGASEESEVVGKLYKGAVAEVIETKDGWTKIASGSVEGYVKNDYCAFRDEAEKIAEEQGTVVATAKTGGLRVRAKASVSENTPIVEMMPEEGTIEVDQDAEAPKGWVPVIHEDETAFVSEKYVDVELELKKAISIEEEQAQAAEEAASSNNSSVSSDDVTLLGALIQCEAGAESFEGQVAVGAVVMNRLSQGYAGSISGVIYQSGQFTPASSGALANALASGVRSSCIQAAQQALSGMDNVNGVTNFRNVNSGISGYVIGNHVFF
jgi:hypothetical protein